MPENSTILAPAQQQTSFRDNQARLASHVMYHRYTSDYKQYTAKVEESIEIYFILSLPRKSYARLCVYMRL
jgi:hypothetical protein